MSNPLSMKQQYGQVACVTLEIDSSLYIANISPCSLIIVAEYIHTAYKFSGHFYIFFFKLSNYARYK